MVTPSEKGASQRPFHPPAQPLQNTVGPGGPWRQPARNEANGDAIGILANLHVSPIALLIAPGTCIFCSTALNPTETKTIAQGCTIVFIDNNDSKKQSVHAGPSRRRQKTAMPPLHLRNGRFTIRKRCAP